MKRRKLFSLLVIALLFIQYQLSAQSAGSKEYVQLIKLIDQYSMYSMAQFDSLYHVSEIDSIDGRPYSEDYWGWVGLPGDKDKLTILGIDGKVHSVYKKNIVAIHYQPLRNALIDSLKEKTDPWKVYDFGNFGRNYLLVSWLDKKGRPDLAEAFLGKTKKNFFPLEFVELDFGTLYYSQMLNIYTGARDYKMAAVYGEHLSRDIFKEYKYQKDIIALTKQLKVRTGDFKTFYLPSVWMWNFLKFGLDREQQIAFLGKRLRLINCIQPGQPAGISYTMFQYVVSIDQSNQLNFSYWDYSNQYSVINPYNELLQMKLSTSEVKSLLPYLLDSSYIPTYTYFRDFLSRRTIHKLSWVVNDLIFEITGKQFLRMSSFDSLSLEEKRKAVAEIENWCDANDMLSDAERIKNIMTSTSSWAEFYKALEEAKEKKYDFIVPIIEKRLLDFDRDFQWPTPAGVMARNMFELGDTTNNKAVLKWCTKSTDNWVLLWTSLFLLKYDKRNFNYAMGRLEKVLKECDGTSYYPHAIGILLKINNKRTKKLAEGILDKEHFQFSIYWDYSLNKVKLLLQSKSDYTFAFLDKNLKKCLQKDGFTSSKARGQLFFKQCDGYIWAVDVLKNKTKVYDLSWDNTRKIDYVKKLTLWLEENYRLYKDGKPNQLDLSPVNTEEPVRFLDAPG